MGDGNSHLDRVRFNVLSARLETDEMDSKSVSMVCSISWAQLAGLTLEAVSIGSKAEITEIQLKLKLTNKLAIYFNFMLDLPLGKGRLAAIFIQILKLISDCNYWIWSSVYTSVNRSIFFN